MKKGWCFWDDLLDEIDALEKSVSQVTVVGHEGYEDGFSDALDQNDQGNGIWFEDMK